jgi:hypothetical protein
MDTAEKPPKPRARIITFVQSAVVPIDSDQPLDTTGIDDGPRVLWTPGLVLVISELTGGS